MEQTGTKRMSPFVGASVAVAVIASLIGIGAIAERTPLGSLQKSQRAQQPVEKRIEAARPAQLPERAVTTQQCATCGTVESVREFAVKGGASGVGAIAGRETVYRVTIRMDDGSYRTISQPIAPGYGVGEKVRVIDSSVVARG